MPQKQEELSNLMTRIEKLETEVARWKVAVEKLRKVYNQYKHMDKVFSTPADKGFSFYVIRDLWLPIKEAVREEST